MVALHRSHVALLLALSTLGHSLHALALPAVGELLPPLEVTQEGQMLQVDDEFEFQPWRTDSLTGKVSVVQYFGATKKDSERFKAFTDQLQGNIDSTQVTVATIINMDAALWGTKGFVMSELKKNKREHPDAVMVIDKKGKGVDHWQLGKEGAAMFITGRDGTLKFVTQQPLNAAEIEEAIALINALSQPQTSAPAPGSDATSTNDSQVQSSP